VQPAENEHLAQVIMASSGTAPRDDQPDLIPEYASFENRAERDQVPQPF